uniref:Odorant binding protein 9 n=1 Tax=Xylotrechus quadripes TaxID=554073 RepID=A0A346HGN1_9CUCU|nr:odorant binding protein 9 [Xylotrechus quadripes]
MKNSVDVMLLLISIGIFTCFVQAEINLTEEQKQKLAVHHKACTVPARDEEFIKKLIDGDLIDDEQFKDYLFCISKRIGFQDASGVVQRAVIIEKLRKSIEDPSKAEEYTDKCLANTSSSPTETVFKVVACINSINPKSSIFSK